MMKPGLAPSTPARHEPVVSLETRFPASSYANDVVVLAEVPDVAGVVPRVEVARVLGQHAVLPRPRVHDGRLHAGDLLGLGRDEILLLFQDGLALVVGHVGRVAQARAGDERQERVVDRRPGREVAGRKLRQHRRAARDAGAEQPRAPRAMMKGTTMAARWRRSASGI
jgi:hypothetical protein